MGGIRVSDIQLTCKGQKVQVSVVGTSKPDRWGHHPLQRSLDAAILRANRMTLPAPRHVPCQATAQPVRNTATKQPQKALAASAALRYHGRIPRQK
jgi:hypothetical protein